MRRSRGISRTFRPPPAERPASGETRRPEHPMEETEMPVNPMDVIRMALDREKIAYRNYTEYARIATQPEIRELFKYLAEEEKKHVKLLSDEIEKETHQEM